MLQTSTEIVQALGGTYKAAKFFNVKPPSVSAWLEKGVIPDERLIPYAARLEVTLQGRFARLAYWPQRPKDIWPDLATAAFGEESHVPA